MQRSAARANDDAQRLQIVLKAAVRAHAVMQRFLPGMTEWRVAEIVGQRNSLDEVLVQPQVARDRPRDLRDLQAMGQARAKRSPSGLTKTCVLDSSRRNAVDE